ncbi:winged helix-turn-helix domain-containing protein [Streptomyces sp. NWU339]|uniref:winged helix-turn-helix domain-containing protein n=1 Tax=Streptomyces sp. NWU339 TaxID=2185284 RepID=UPI00215B5421|nr:winged helix-turn-helix domain-containing protein [Streptomyces sp. NWU339]
MARNKTVIGRLFRVSYTVEGTWLLLKRHGWSWQQATRRAIPAGARCAAPRGPQGRDNLAHHEIEAQVLTGSGHRRMRRLRAPGASPVRRRRR